MTAADKAMVVLHALRARDRSEDDAYARAMRGLRAGEPLHGCLAPVLELGDPRLTELLRLLLRRVERS